MGVKSRWRGHVIEFFNGVWLYEDTGFQVSQFPDRPCGYCGIPQTKDGHDPCISNLPGVKNACCGHGSPEDSYIQFEDGTIIRNFTKLERNGWRFF